VPFRLKHNRFVDLAKLQSEGDRRIGIEPDTSRLRTMNTAQVHGQLLVDENPNVVIARKVELLVAFVLEPVPNFAGEMEIVPIPFITPTNSIEREEIGVVVLEASIHELVQREFLQNGHVDTGHIPVPLIEIRFSGRGGRRRITCINEFSVHAEVIHDDGQVVAQKILENWMGYFEVPQDNGNFARIYRIRP